MTIWLDAQLSPALAAWIAATFGVDCHAVRDLGLRDAKDSLIFQAARAAEATVMTKDSDFVELLTRLGSPPKMLWLTCGNTSNAHLRHLLSRLLPRAIKMLDDGEILVEISDVSGADSSG
jgi:predicted nuclease of predicted toxin-antitoxin system